MFRPSSLAFYALTESVFPVRTLASICKSSLISAGQCCSLARVLGLKAHWKQGVHLCFGFNGTSGAIASMVPGTWGHSTNIRRMDDEILPDSFIDELTNSHSSNHHSEADNTQMSITSLVFSLPGINVCVCDVRKSPRHRFPTSGTSDSLIPPSPPDHHRLSCPPKPGLQQ